MTRRQRDRCLVPAGLHGHLVSTDGVISGALRRAGPLASARRASPSTAWTPRRRTRSSRPATLPSARRDLSPHRRDGRVFSPRGPGLSPHGSPRGAPRGASWRVSWSSAEPASPRRPSRCAWSGQASSSWAGLAPGGVKPIGTAAVRSEGSTQETRRPGACVAAARGIPAWSVVASTGVVEPRQAPARASMYGTPWSHLRRPAMRKSSKRGRRRLRVPRGCGFMTVIEQDPPPF